MKDASVSRITVSTIEYTVYIYTIVRSYEYTIIQNAMSSSLLLQAAVRSGRSCRHFTYRNSVARNQVMHKSTISSLPVAQFVVSAAWKANGSNAINNAKHHRCISKNFSSDMNHQIRSLSTGSSSMFRTDLNFLDDADNDEMTETKEEAPATLSEREMRRQRGAIKLQELDAEREKLRATKKGRGWTDPWDLDPFIERGADFNALLDWAPEYVSRISQERVQIYNKDGRTIPTLAELATEISLPLPPPPNPGHHMKAYALYRKRYMQQYIYTTVVQHAEPKVNEILKLNDWDSKQDAIDIMYEQIEFSLRESESILSKQPNFGTMVERAIEKYLRTVQMTLKEKATATATDTPPVPTASGGDPLVATTLATPEQRKIELRKKDEIAVPIFMDCYNKEVDKPDVPVPEILKPMKSSVPLKVMLGRMVEEWELSALKTSKRIMLRQCTRTIAQIILDATIKTNNDSSRSSSSKKIPEPTSTTDANVALVENTNTADIDAVTVSSNQPASARILVHGTQGVGKTAVLASIVACARQSGAIVLFLPDGNQLHQNGFYIEPDIKRPGMFNLPILSQTVCRHFMESHEKDLKDFMIDAEDLEKFFTESQIGKLKEYTKGTSMNLVSLLNYGIDRSDLAPMCYSAAMFVLMKQNEKDFIMVLDEGNCCYIPKGHYYHEEYDYDVKKSIPYHQINLFEPFMTTMNVTSLIPSDDDYSPTLDATSILPPNIQRGAVIISTTESHAIPRIVTQTLVANAKIVAGASSSTSAPLHVVEVPRLATIEVQHMLSNYEATGVGNLRLDRGATVMNPHEVSYLHMVSGGIPQHLMNACML